MTSTTNSIKKTLNPQHLGFIPFTGVTHQETVTSVAKQKINEQNIDRILLNSLAVAPNSETLATVAYRWRGEDTLTVGNFASWVTASYIRSSFKVNTDRPEDYNFLVDYSDLHKVVSVAKLPQVRTFYEFRNLINVIAFLASNSILIDWLIDSHSTLVKYFGVKTRFILEVVSEPGSSNHEQLVIAVQSSCTVDEGMAKLENLDKNWFFEQINVVDDKVIINLEFV